MNSLESALDVLAIAPHPDDAELGVGGTLAQCRRNGSRVGVLDLTGGEPTPHGSRELRRQETDAATKVLDLTWRYNLGLPNRNLEHTLEARRAVAEIMRLTRPRVVLAPFWEDVHPDHVAASQMIDAARFWSKLSKSDMRGEPYWPPRLYYYWSVHLRIHPKPSFIFDISETIEQKLASVRCYASQFITGRPQEHPTILDDLRDRARYWGWAIGKAYGEPLASREDIGIGAFDVLC